MNDYRLVRLYGRQKQREWLLPRNGTTLIGRGQPHGGGFAVDLSPDRMVSHEHGRLRFVDDSWWLEAQPNKPRIDIDGRAYEGGPVQLSPWSRITFGSTIVLFVPPNGYWLRNDTLLLGLEVDTTLNFAVVRTARSRLPFVSRVVVHHVGTRPSSATTLRLGLPLYGKEKEVSIPSLQPGRFLSLPTPAFVFDPQAFEAPASREVCLSATLDGEALQGDLITCKVLPSNTCSLVDSYYHRLSLASFVQPNHPRIALLTAHACRDLPARPEPMEVLKAVYNHLFEQWHVKYEKDPVSETSEQDQLIRLPHDVLYDFRPGDGFDGSDSPGSYGRGTCLDLALVIAACLESLHCYPLIAFRKIGTDQHVLVGCRKASYAGLKPLLYDLESSRHDQHLLEAVQWVDPNGCTRDPRYRMAYAQSCEWARQQLEDKDTFLFALDVFAARSKEVEPLPFSGSPQWGGAAIRAREEAEHAAEKYGRPQSSVLLLWGLLALPDGAARQVIATLGLSPAIAQERLERFILNNLPEDDPKVHSENYILAIDTAPTRAKQDGSPVILDSHLLCALLDTHAGTLRKALAQIDLSWEGVHRMVCQGFGRSTFFSTTFFGD